MTCCRHCSTRVRPCRRFMVTASRPRDVCAPCAKKIDRAARAFVKALAGEEVRG